MERGDSLLSKCMSLSLGGSALRACNAYTVNSLHRLNHEVSSSEVQRLQALPGAVSFRPRGFGWRPFAIR